MSHENTKRDSSPSIQDGSGADEAGDACKEGPQSENGKHCAMDEEGEGQHATVQEEDEGKRKSGPGEREATPMHTENALKTGGDCNMETTINQQ